MLKNYLKIACRNLVKNKAFSIINILGLSIGMAACFFIYQYIHFELSYDRFHRNAARLYRVTLTYSGSISNGKTNIMNHPGVGPAMKADFPEVETFARIAPSIVFFKTELLKNPAITRMAPSSEIPGQRIYAKNAVRRMGQDKTHNYMTNLVEVDKDYIPTYQIKLAAGNNLPDNELENVFETLKTKVLINEEIVKALEFKSNEEALHQTIVFVSWFGDIKGEVVGVVKNYHQRSFKETYAPMLFYNNNRSQWSYFSLNIKSTDLSRDMHYIENLYNKIFPGNAFESFFLDEYVDRQYKSDQQFGKVFGLFTALAIFIACMGLTGLSIFAIKVRTKEMGIRKVLGASTGVIVFLFSKDFIRLVGIAAIVATPVIYLIAKEWLNNFAFHIQLNWYYFVLSPLLLLIIAMITVSLQSLTIAYKNPVNCLRND